MGIDLLVATKFPSTSAYHQGLGRVGRYGEPCGRYKWKKLAGEMVDKQQEYQILSKIVAKGNKNR